MPQALDLTKEFPRSPYTELDGYMWLPRLIDKARAGFAGTRGEYTAYPCGADKRFIAAYGLDADALGEVIKSGASDEEIVAWVKANQKAVTAEEVAAFRKHQLAPITDPEMLAYFTPMRDAAAPGRPEIDNWSKLIAVEENHAIPASV
ncbi:MAG TPA: DUF5069 domain-containing protein [Pantanalinema sp.]